MAPLMPSDHLFAVLSDTHVGDRSSCLHPAMVQAIRDCHPEEIWHAGDVGDPSVLRQLGAIAPVQAVQGNRDWFNRLDLPKILQFEINSVKITLTHGHISMSQYALNYLRLLVTFHKLSYVRFQKYLARLYPESDLIIYGHTHYQVDEMVYGQHFINPGAAYPHRLNNYTVQYCLLTITSTGKVQALKRTIYTTA